MTSILILILVLGSCSRLTVDLPPTSPWIEQPGPVEETFRWEDAVVAYKTGLSTLGTEPSWVRQLAQSITRR
jgi:hypothetical protein